MKSTYRPTNSKMFTNGPDEHVLPFGDSSTISRNIKSASQPTVNCEPDDLRSYLLQFYKLIPFFIFLAVISSAGSSYAKCREIIDTEGRTVAIPENIHRAVVLSGTCIETIYILGSLDRVAGISRSIIDSALCNFIPALKKIPVIAQSIRNINIERVLALKPDILVTMGPEHPLGMDRKTIKRLEEFGIPVVLLNLESLDENYYSIELMGTIFGNERRAAELISHMKGIIGDIQGKLKKIDDTRRIKALYISGARPNYIAGGYWGKQDIRVLAGAHNVAKEIKLFMTTVSFEQISIWNPDVITISASAKYTAADVINDPHLRHINAVRQKRVYKHPREIAGLFTPRVPLLLAWHTAKFYPELMIDWAGITDKFFKKFYGVLYHGPRD